MSNFIIRDARPEDSHILLDFIKKIAEYEILLDQVVCNAETVRHSIFDLNAAKALLAYEDDEPVAFAIYFYNFSTFLGRPGLHLEDIFVNPDKRGMGYGKKIFEYIMELSVKENCGRMEWTCLDWNKPSIDFYLSMDAEPMDEWTTYRLTEEKLKAYFNK